MKYKAVIETDDYTEFEFFEDGNGKFMIAKDACASANGWIPLYFTECEQEPSEDCISRSSVVEEMEKRHAEGDYITKGFINSLPSVTPQESKWIPIKTRPLTKEEKEHFAEQGYSDDSICFMYDCPLPDDGQEVLITTSLGDVRIDTFCRDDGCYFEDYCDADDVLAWMPLPKPYKVEREET